MSTATEKTDNPRLARLVRGRVYFLGDREFGRETALPVTADEEAHLRKHAVDQLTLEGEDEFQHRQKFEFGTAEDFAKSDAAAQRTREQSVEQSSGSRRRIRG